MSTEIPDAAVEAGHGVTYGQVHNDDMRAILEAALPHLRAVILAGLRTEIEGVLADIPTDILDLGVIGARLKGEASSLKLVLSYIGDAERAAQ